MFQPLGPLVFQGQVTDEQLRVIHSDYPPDHYVVFESEGDAKGATKVFLRRETPDKDVMDLAKQIVGIERDWRHHLVELSGRKLQCILHRLLLLILLCTGRRIADRSHNQRDRRCDGNQAANRRNDRLGIDGQV